MNKQQYFFVLGNPRSGTSLLRIMINEHSEITVPPECGFMQWWFDKYKDWENLEYGNRSQTLDEFIQDLSTSKKIETWGLNFDKLKNKFLNEFPKNYEELVFKVVDFYGESKLKKVRQAALGDKNNYYLNHLNTLKKISPSAKFIILFREPKDVYCSYVDIKKLKSTSPYKPNLTIDLDDFINEWILNHERLINFSESLNDANTIFINFNTLIENTKNELIRITDFLKLNFNDSMLSYYHKNNEPLETLDWKQKTLQPPDNSVINRYIKVLNKNETEKINFKTNKIYQTLVKKSCE